jgi:hypothetical protein
MCHGTNKGPHKALRGLKILSGSNLIYLSEDFDLDLRLEANSTYPGR